MISTDDLRFFVTLSDFVSLAAVARALNVTPSAVTQRLRLLEERLGVRLVDRSGRRLALTDEGRLLAQHAQNVLNDIGQIADMLAARRGVVSGHLRILAPLGFGRRYVAPVAAAFRTAFPDVQIDLMLSDRPFQFREEIWDVLIYIGELRDSALVGRTLAPNARLLCAAPDYVARHGMPATPNDLACHSCIVLKENDENITHWRLAPERDGNAVSVRIRPALTTNDGGVARAWARAGMGIVMRSEWDVAEDLAAHKLVEVLPGWRVPPANVVALVHARHGRSARTTRFIEHLQAALQPVPWRTPRGTRPSS
ncbi:MAG TPA: LysR family transcriptional regulator [Acidocella sp.]|uniref:LysR family transcriptional regulator n=1 Tax=Acidocella sp. TaxID=50710 RepID=UPI002B8C7441|nr:LysR family transcriptional regulator [Acidocella sp.]HVE21390.1 LysR family transcriptional regulator [Acidocella sp.]